MSQDDWPRFLSEISREAKAALAQMQINSFNELLNFSGRMLTVPRGRLPTGDLGPLELALQVRGLRLAPRHIRSQVEHLGELPIVTPEYTQRRRRRQASKPRHK